MTQEHNPSVDPLAQVPLFGILEELEDRRVGIKQDFRQAGSVAERDAIRTEMADLTFEAGAISEMPELHEQVGAVALDTVKGLTNLHERRARMRKGDFEANVEPHKTTLERVSLFLTRYREADPTDGQSK